MAGFSWSRKEIEKLEQLVGSVPYPIVHIYYNEWALESSFTKRTKRSVYCKINSLSLDKEMVDDWLTMAAVAKLLGIPEYAPRRWATCKMVKAVKFSKRRGATWYVKRSQLISLAKRKPYLFGGINPDNLFNLFENKELADQIAFHYPRRMTDPKAVVALETGKVFPSISAAARSAFVHPSSILHAIRTSGTSAGLHWRFRVSGVGRPPAAA